MNNNDQFGFAPRIFYPYATSKRLMAKDSGARFVHYTSAEAAMGVISGREVWVRNSTTMNDFMEIDYGLRCVASCYNGDLGDRFKKLLDRMFSGFSEKLEARFDEWVPHLRADTYLVCISEHDDDEDDLGRLSMWRAYGGAAGVAVVLNGSPFLRHSDALRAYTNPVAYLAAEDFRGEFKRVIDLIDDNISFVKSLGEESVMAHAFGMLRYATLCTKHPGFREEREWRVVYSPSFQSSHRVAEDIKIIRGVPQKIYKIPLRNVPEEGLVGVDVSSLINRIIIGPTQHPRAIRDAFVSILKNAGVDNPERKVCISDIPLRQ